MGVSCLWLAKQSAVLNEGQGRDGAAELASVGMRTGERKLGLTTGSGVSGGVTVEGHLQEEMAMEKQAPAAARLTTTGCRVLTTLPTHRLDVSPCPNCPARPTVMSVGIAQLCGSTFRDPAAGTGQPARALVSDNKDGCGLNTLLQKAPMARATVAGHVRD